MIVQTFNKPYKITFHLNISEVFKNPENFSFGNMNIWDLLNIANNFKVEPKIKSLHEFVINNNHKLDNIKNQLKKDTKIPFTLLPVFYPLIAIFILGILYKSYKIYRGCTENNANEQPQQIFSRRNSGEFTEAEIINPPTPLAPPHIFTVKTPNCTPKSTPIPVPRRSRSK